MLLSKTSITIFELLVFSNILTEISCAKILAVFSIPSISHQVVFRPLTQELAKRGHEVTVITPDPVFPKGGAPDNLIEIDVHDVSYNTFRKLFQEQHSVNVDFMNFSGIKQMGTITTEVFKAQLQYPEVQTLIKNKENKYDLLIIEPANRPSLIFSHLFKAPVILISSIGVVPYYDNILGAPGYPLLYRSPMNKRINDLSVIEKLKELYYFYSISYAYYLNEKDETEELRQILGPNIPPISDLYDYVDMLFVNAHPIWAENRPMPPSIVFMGGIHQTPKKELPKDLKTYLDSSKRGVIYLSFGTNVLSEMIPQDKLKIFVEVLSQLPYDVLWKWDKDELPGKGDNIKLSKWFPQSDLLLHPNIKLFITQAGLQSTEEAISAAVPLLAVPMLADQWFNAEKYVKHGIGKKIQMEILSAEKFRSAVEIVIKDTSYRNNIMKLRDIINDQPETPLQRVVWWTEYVIRHGRAKHLRSPAANISYAEYFEVEVLAIVALAFCVIVISFIFIIVFLLYSLRRLFGSKEKLKKN